MNKGQWLARAGGGAVAGLIIAGAGFGVAVAGATGNSTQYTKGAKPYAGVTPHDVTIGSSTLTVPGVTLSVPGTVSLPTVTQPYTVTVPYTTTLEGTTTTATQTVYSTATQTQTQTQTETQTQTAPGTTVTAPGTTRTETDAQTTYYPVIVTKTTSSGSALGGTPTSTATLTALLKIDLRQLLAPQNAAELRTANLAKAKTLRLSYLSPGVGTVKVVWTLKVSKPHAATVKLVSSRATLKRYGASTLVVKLSQSGRKLLAHATRASIQAKVTYSIAKVGGFTLTRTVQLIG